MIKWSYMVMTNFVVSCTRCSGSHFTRLNSTAHFFHTVYDFFKDTFNNLLFALCIIHSHKRTYQTVGSLSANASGIIKH